MFSFLKIQFYFGFRQVHSFVKSQLFMSLPFLTFSQSTIVAFVWSRCQSCPWLPLHSSSDRIMAAKLCTQTTRVRTLTAFLFAFDGFRRFWVNFFNFGQLRKIPRVVCLLLITAVKSAVVGQVLSVFVICFILRISQLFRFQCAHGPSSARAALGIARYCNYRCFPSSSWCGSLTFYYLWFLLISSFFC